MLFVVPTSFYHAVLSAVNELVGNFLGFIPDDPCVPCFVVSFISFSSVLGRSNSPPYFSIILAKKSVHLSKSAFTIGAPPVCPDDDPNAAVLVHAALVCATLHLPEPADPAERHRRELPPRREEAAFLRQYLHLPAGGSAAHEGGGTPHLPAGIYQRTLRHRQDSGTEDVRKLQPAVRHQLHRRDADQPLRTERQLPPGEQPRTAGHDTENPPGQVPERRRLGSGAEYAQRAKDVNSKCAVAYLLSGDVALKLNDVNKASSDYNQAIYLDENCSEAYFKYAQVYKGVDPQLSLDMLMRLQTKAPDDNRISKELADVYYTMGQYGKAKEAYESYLKVGTPTEQDYTRYAMLLYLNKDYAQSSDMVKKGLELAPENHVLKRLAMYDNLELKDYKEGLEAAATFFSNPGNPDYVYLDYVYFARLLEADKQYDEAVAQFDKALAMDKSHTEIYKDISDVYEKERDFPKAIEAYKNYLGGMKGDPDISDLFLYGRLNYYAATDSAYQDKQPLYLAEADTIFAQVAAKVPDNYLGNFWRARVNSLRDPETTQGLAKPYYEAALSILEQKPDATKSVLVECNSYLGYYYFVKEDYNQSKLYWNKILEIDPGNETATKALGGIK